MPARKKSPERRQGRGTADLAIVRPDATPLVAVDRPPMPTRLLAVTKESWESFWDSEIARFITSSDHPALVRLFRLYDEHERAMRAYQGQRAVEGSTHQMIVNPFAKQADAYAGQILALEDRFGLTPAARLKLGISFGEAKRSLDEVNRSLAEDDDDDGSADEDDPRLGAIETTAVDRPMA